MIWNNLKFGYLRCLRNLPVVAVYFRSEILSAQEKESSVGIVNKGVDVSNEQQATRTQHCTTERRCDNVHNVTSLLNTPCLFLRNFLRWVCFKKDHCIIYLKGLSVASR